MLFALIKKCRGVIGHDRTRQKNKFKGYKKGPGVVRLKFPKNDSIKRATTPVPIKPVKSDTVAVPTTTPALQDTTIVFVFSEVLFDTNSSHLKDEFMNRLDSIGSMIKSQRNECKVKIGGHTDNSGKEDFNVRLSNDRAKAVGTYLVTIGVLERAITSEGLGC